MKIFEFTRHYPVPFKPYYDTHFAELVEQGHDLTVFSAGQLDDTLNEKVLEYGLHRRTHRYPTTLRTVPATSMQSLKNLVRSPGASMAAVQRVLAERRDGRGLKGSFLEAVRCMSVCAGSPDVCIIQGLGTAVLFSWLGNAFPDTLIAMYYHGGEVPSTDRLDPDAVPNAFGMADVVFTNTEFSRRHAVERGCPSDKIEILPVGFSIRDFGPPPGKPETPPLRMLSAGRMSEEKGHIYALRAVKRLLDRGITEIRYRITGDGYIRSELEEYVDRAGLRDHVQFLGILTTEELMSEMRAAHALVLPSIQVGNWVENQACAVQEAMLQRCVVVTTRTGGVPESIPDCMKDFSVPEKDPDALATSLATVVGLEREERERLADECRRFVVNRYDITKLNTRMLERIRGSDRKCAA